MVSRKIIKSKYALISVYDKSNLNYLCNHLNKNNYNIISTGSTSTKIRSLGYKCIEVAKLTNFKEILGGRVKTLNPKIYGSILYLRDNNNHKKEFDGLNFPQIDLVVINLYPFKKFSSKNNFDKTIEMIDVGGPSLLRASGKNFKYVTTIFNINDYKKLVDNLNKNSGITDISFRKSMAVKVFKHISNYDSLISNWLGNKRGSTTNKKRLRYGENPNQNSFIVNNRFNSIFNYQINGKDISYNNIVDVDNGIQCLNEFKEPSCVIIKHNNPCGVASAKNIELAFKKAFRSDTKSAFGGILLLNKTIDKKFAILLSKFFLEVISAKGYTKDALDILSKKKKLVLLKIPNIKINKYEYRSTVFGTIYQQKDIEKINKSFLKLVAYKKVSQKSLNDLIFALKIVKYLKSNAIVLAKNKQTVGIGAGQTNRVDSLKISLKKSKDNNVLKNFVCVSDGFFPFTDSLKLLKKNNCNIVAQPSGSINDSKNISYSKENKISLYFIKNRLFKH